MIDSTYSRELANLPPDDHYSANADQDVSALGRYGVPNTEAVMQQGASYDEAQRTLSADDVAGIRYAMSGLNELQGTADDYTIHLIYAGLTSAANIVIGFNNSQTGFATTYVNGAYLFDGLDELSARAAGMLQAAAPEVLFGPEPNFRSSPAIG